MKKLSFFKRLKLLFDYIRVIKQKKEAIVDKKNMVEIRIDKAKRFYTVCSCPDEVSKYGKSLAEKYIKEHVSKCEKIFIDTNLTEYIGIRDIQQIDELNFLIIFGFKGFRTEKLFRNMVILSLLSIGAIIYFFLNFF